jgi:hypothetical protein
MLDTILVIGVWWVLRRKVQMSGADTQRKKIAVYLRMVGEIATAIANALDADDAVKDNQTKVTAVDEGAQNDRGPETKL